MAAAVAVPIRKKRSPYKLKIVRPEFAEETIAPAESFTKVANDELEALYSRDLSPVEQNIFLFLWRRTRGWFFGDQARPPKRGEFPRPRAVGPEYARDEHGNITAIIGVREILSRETGYSMESIDFGLQKLKSYDNPIVEAVEDRNYLWLVFRPENLPLLPRRQEAEKPARKPPAQADGTDDPADQPRDAVPPVNIGGHSTSKWYNVAGTMVRFANKGTAGQTAGLQKEEQGITVVFPDPEADYAAEPVPISRNGTTGKKLPLLDSQHPTNQQHAKLHGAKNGDSGHEATEQVGFEAFLEACEQGGLVYTDLQITPKGGALRLAWQELTFAQKHAAISGIRDRIEHGTYPQFAPKAFKYLDEHLWTEKLRSKPKPVSNGKRQRTDWDSI